MSLHSSTHPYRKCQVTHQNSIETDLVSLAINISVSNWLIVRPTFVDFYASFFFFRLLHFVLLMLLLYLCYCINDSTSRQCGRGRGRRAHSLLTCHKLLHSRYILRTYYFKKVSLYVLISKTPGRTGGFGCSIPRGGAPHSLPGVGFSILSVQARSVDLYDFIYLKFMFQSGKNIARKCHLKKFCKLNL